MNTINDVLEEKKLANVSDLSPLTGLLHEDDWGVPGDAGSVHNGVKRAARKAGVLWGAESSSEAPIGAGQKRRNRRMPSIRNRGAYFPGDEAAIRVHQNPLRGSVKNAAQVFILIGLTNLYLERRASMA